MGSHLSFSFPEGTSCNRHEWSIALLVSARALRPGFPLFPLLGRGKNLQCLV